MSNRKLTPEEEAIRSVLVAHIRVMSFDPEKPQACACGWRGTGKRKGSGLHDHIARQIAKVFSPNGAAKHECGIPSPGTIGEHRAHGEDLCEGCSTLLRAIA